LTIPARLLLVALTATIVLSVIALLSDWAALDLLGRLEANEALVSQAEVDATDIRQGAIGLLQLLLRTATGVAFIVWFHRAYTNLPWLGARSLRFSSAWTIAGWFVPFLNLVQPKQLMDDIWRATDPVLAGQPNSAWRQGRVSKLIHFWWGAFLASSIAVGIANSLFAEAANPQQTQDATQADLAASLAVIAAAILAFVLVRQVTQREDDASARLALGHPT
jgi:hypothetical protein